MTVAVAEFVRVRAACEPSASSSSDMECKSMLGALEMQRARTVREGDTREVVSASGHRLQAGQAWMERLKTVGE